MSLTAFNSAFAQESELTSTELNDVLSVNLTRAEIEKLEAETKKINKEISQLENPTTPTTDYLTIIIMPLVTLVLPIIGTAIAALVAYTRSKKIIPFSDREKTFRETTRNRYNNLYRQYWKILQKTIHDAPDKKSRIDRIWVYVGRRSFPKIMKNKIIEDHINYVREKVIELEIIPYKTGALLHEKEKYEKRVRSLAYTIAQSASTEYLEWVEKKLPKLVSIAVIKNRPREILEDDKIKYYDDYEGNKIQIWNEESFDSIKELMIMNNIAEHHSTVRSMIDVEIKKIILGIDKDSEKSTEKKE